MKEASKKKKVFLVLFTILFVAIISLGVVGYSKVLNTDLIYQGVKVDGLDISFMTKEEALKFIKEKKEAELDGKGMTLNYYDQLYNVGLKELGFHYDYNKAIDEAYSIGREGSIVKRIKDIIKVRQEGINIELDSNYNREKVNQLVDRIAEDIDIAAKDAEFHFNNGNIKVTAEVVGKVVDKEELTKLINDNIHTLEDIEIPVEHIIPKVTKDLLSRINGVIGEFSTSFKGSSKSRIENIRLSSQAIKGTLLMPGESMSFNETTGPREKKYGYQEAIVIIAGEFTPDVGGGVCQTSTTLYNALLLADVTILERSPHSIPSTYVNLGQDAAVAYGFLDLKFRNDFDFPIYIDSKIIGDRLYFYIYGDKNAKDYTVKIEPQVVEVIQAKEETILDKNLKPGEKVLVQQGRTGYRVYTYKSIIKNGKTVSRELITKDYYKPRNFIYKIGEEPAEPTSSNQDNDVKVDDTNTNEDNADNLDNTDFIDDLIEEDNTED